MRGEYGICDRPGCGAPADYLVEGRNKLTGEPVRHPICEQHFRDLTTPCAADGCDMVGRWVIDWKGHLPDGTERTEEVRFCDEHWHELQSSVAVTVNGVSMIHDGQGHFKALPGDVGRG